MVISIVLAVISGVLAGQFHHGLGIAPMLAGVLCAASFLRRRDALIAALGAVVVRDLFVGLSLFTLVRLLAVLSVMGIIWAVRVRPALKPLLVALILASPTYHLMLAVGDWGLQFCSTEPRTPLGLFTTIRTGWPYFQHAFLGELLFTSAFVVAYAAGGSLVRLRWPAAIPQAVRG